MKPNILKAFTMHRASKTQIARQKSIFQKKNYSTKKVKNRKLDTLGFL
jgi:hypothetical protein